MNTTKSIFPDDFNKTVKESFSPMIATYFQKGLENQQNDKKIPYD